MNINSLEIYGDSYQMGLIKVCIEDPSFFSSIQEHLTANLFTLEYAKIYFDLIKSYKKKYKVLPTYDVLETLVRTHYQNHPFERDIALIELYKIKSNTIHKSIVYIKEQALSFCQRQLFQKTLQKAQDVLKRAEKNPQDPFDLSILEDFHAIKNINLEPVDSNIFDHVEDILTKGSREKIRSTGLVMLDYILGGGVAAGEVHTIAAYTNIGKTMFMRNIGANILSQGYVTLHFTLEDSARKVEAGYLSRLTGIPYSMIQTEAEEVRIRLKKYEEKGIELHVKEYPKSRYTIDKLESYYLKLLDQGINIDVVIIDSPLHLLPTVVSNNERTNIGKIWKETEGFAQQYKLPIIATAQLNRDSTKDVNVSGTDKVGEAIQIAQDSASFTTINRKPKHMIADTALLHNAKTREGQPGETWEVKWDGATGTIEEFEDIVSERIRELESHKKMRPNTLKIKEKL